MCRAWFEEIDPVELDAGLLQLCVREPVQLRYLQRNCTDAFAEAAQDVTGHLCAVRFVSPEECETDRRPIESSTSSSTPSSSACPSSQDIR